GARRADPDDPAPRRSRRRGVQPAGLRGPRARRGRARGAARRRARRADGDRVPAAALPDAQPAPGAHAQPAARARLGLRLRRRRARAGDVRQLPAQEARPPRPAAHPHRARRRIRAPPAAGMMASLRARLVAGLLALAAAGLLLLAGITYVKQRSFLFDRLDQQVRSAPAAVEHALADQGIGPAFDEDDRRRGPGPGGGPPPPNLLPLGTYGERRDASGRVLGSHWFAYGTNETDKPKLPARLPTRRLLTVNGHETRYRVLAMPDRFGGGTTVVAVPMRDVDQTLHRLLAVEGLVIAGVRF